MAEAAADGAVQREEDADNDDPMDRKPAAKPSFENENKPIERSVPEAAAPSAVAMMPPSANSKSDGDHVEEDEDPSVRGNDSVDHARKTPVEEDDPELDSTIPANNAASIAGKPNMQSDDDNEEEDSSSSGSESDNDDDDDTPKPSKKDNGVDEKPTENSKLGEGAAAKPNNRGEDSSDNDSDDDGDDSSSSGNDDDDDDTPKPRMTEDGRELSEYEYQRLERIKRNRHKLEQLGLEGKGGGGVLGEKKKPQQRKRKKTDAAPAPSRRSSIKRRTTTKKLSYAEPTASMRDLVRIVKGQAVPLKAGTGETVVGAGVVATTTTQPNDVTATVEGQELIVASPEKKKATKTKSVNDAREQFIHVEFKRLKGLKTKTLRLAERNHRAADKEVKYWQKRMAVWEKKHERELIDERQRQAEAQERQSLGGLSIKELLHEIDTSMPKIQETVERYDDSLNFEKREREKEIKRVEAEQKLKTLDALDRFPKAMKNAVSVLNAVLLERAPKDPPPPRRSRRSVGDEEPAATTAVEPTSPTKKKEPKGKKRTSESPTTNEQVELQVDAASLLGVTSKEDETSEKPVASSATSSSSAGVKQRQRVVRNVGGWISPNFAHEIDKTWLTQDQPPRDFDLPTYVPQVGDTVLYYISGHRQYLKEYPDVLGKKTRGKLRVPLWQKAAHLKEERQKNEHEPGESVPDAKAAWWTDEWLEGIESSNLGHYPILCRVERNHAEFPPDPYSKVIRKDEKSGASNVYFRKPKGFSGSTEAPVRLAVTLRPLTPVLAPKWKDASIVDAPLPVPPTFTVVTFPCTHIEPFLVPFAWAYALTHSLALNQKVAFGPGDGTKVRVDNFATLGDRGALRLEERANAIQSVLSRLDAAPSKTAALEKELENHRDLPLRDARVVLDVWLSAMKQPSDSASVSSSLEVAEEAAGFVDLLRSTLPLWQSVTIMRNMYDRKKTTLSPWRLIPPGKGHELASPWTIGTRTFGLDESLRVKIECMFEDFTSEEGENMDAVDLFYYPVTEEIAPSYFCAVPVGMCLEDIVQRVQLQGKSNRCYYRSVEAICADVTSIVDCCLLYNSPDAAISVEATSVAGKLRDSITRITNEHYRESKEARKVDDERRKLVLRSESRSKSRTNVINTLRRPFKEPLYREWLDRTQRESTHASVDNSGVEKFEEPFQAGDLVVYSREEHAAFVKGHYPSLEADQCVVPSPEAVLGAESVDRESTIGDGPDIAGPESANSAPPPLDDWCTGEIIWARAAFPKSMSKQSGEDANTFASVAALQCLGIKCPQSKDVFEVYWRPCEFHSGGSSTAKGACPRCGLRPFSFIHLDSQHSREPVEEKENIVAADAISVELRQSIERCINLLKRRCLRKVPPAHVDPLLTKESVRAGYKTLLSKFGKKTLPEYDRLFNSDVPEEKEDIETANHGTRGVASKPAKKDPSVATLVAAGFLPPWVSDLSGGTVDDILLQKLGTILPSPTLCLELIQIRLRNDFYRQRAAVENDIVEAYLCTAFMILAEAAVRKKSPISVKRVARQLAAKKEISGGNGLQPTEEELSWIERMRRVRELYATALVSVSDAFHTERVFGLVSYSLPKPIAEVQDTDPVRVAARQDLAYLLNAVGKDECLNNLCVETKEKGKEWYQPIMRLTVKSDGRALSYDRGSFATKLLGAEVAGKLFKVKVVCEGQTVSFGKPDKPLSPDAIDAVSDERSQAGNVTAPSVYFGPDDCERNDALAKLMYQRPGRSGACARCQAYKRSMVVCRFYRKHSNLDYNWGSDMKGGFSRIDSLLRVLEPGTVTARDASEKVVDDREVTVQLSGEPEKEPSKEINKSDTGAASNNDDDGAQKGDDDEEEEGGDGAGNISDHGGDDGEEEGGGDGAGDDGEEEGGDGAGDIADPRELAKKAVSALELATAAVTDAKTFAEAPIRLSKEFIEESFPIDESDGHYLYCVVCGLSGDLLCCDGCANVVHANCVSLTDLPEGDWFCEECNKGDSTAGEEKASIGLSEEHAKATLAPFGRFEFDEERIEGIVAILDDLRSARPTQKIKKLAALSDDDDASVESGDDATSKRKRKRLSKKLLEEDGMSSSADDKDARPRRPRRSRAAAEKEDKPKKSRGRPPKRDTKNEASPSKKKKRGRGELNRSEHIVSGPEASPKKKLSRGERKDRREHKDIVDTTSEPDTSGRKRRPRRCRDCGHPYGIGQRWATHHSGLGQVGSGGKLKCTVPARDRDPRFPLAPGAKMPSREFVQEDKDTASGSAQNDKGSEVLSVDETGGVSRRSNARRSRPPPRFKDLPL